MVTSKFILSLVLFSGTGITQIAMIEAQTQIQQVPEAYDSLLFTEDFFALVNSRLDPLVTPGKVSGHVHHVVGGSAFAATQDYAMARNAKCTSSNLACDLSNYWTPHLYYKWRNGSYTAVTGDGMTNYWKYPLTNVDKADPFAALPDDFRMLAGDIKRDDFDPHKAVSFLCVDAQGIYHYSDDMPTDRECPTLRPQLHFPECWNGVDSYKEDNSHVAYPIDANPEGGVCPEGFKKIPHLLLESTYHITPENIGEGYEWYPGCFVLANGDNNGFSFHADWLNGFPSNFLTEAFHQCYDTASGLLIKDCPYITQFRGDTGRGCVTEGDVINELVGQHVAIPALPGNNPEYNSSKYSDNYPKGSIQGYTEQASIVKASDATGGFCIEGLCTDYIGSDLVAPQSGGAAVVPANNTSAGTTPSGAPAAGASASSAITDSVPPSNSASGTAPTNVLGPDATMSIFPISVDPVNPSGTIPPTAAAVQNSVTAPAASAPYDSQSRHWSRRNGRRRL